MPHLMDDNAFTALMGLNGQSFRRNQKIEQNHGGQQGENTAPQGYWRVKLYAGPDFNLTFLF